MREWFSSLHCFILSHVFSTCVIHVFLKLWANTIISFFLLLHVQYAQFKSVSRYDIRPFIVKPQKSTFELNQSFFVDCKNQNNNLCELSSREMKTCRIYYIFDGKVPTTSEKLLYVCTGLISTVSDLTSNLEAIIAVLFFFLLFFCCFIVNLAG